ncbi:MAG: DapH/DapD/GlmU-related protein [Ignavibacteria bacterium]|jgi:acetyltransferase-like isoleucine patch superfamily enzyme
MNKLINFFDSITLIIFSFFSSTYMKLDLMLRGVVFVPRIKFFGRAKFVKASLAKISIGSNCSFRSSSTSNLIGINRPCIISSTGKGSMLSIGNNCGFSGTVIGCFQAITIGNNVRCGANTLVTDSDWHLSDSRVSLPKPVIIEDNVWLGVNVIVMKGVTIGKNSVIGAGSVVVKSIPANVVAAGNPCKVIKEINENKNTVQQ